jgi:hypothetical protein
MRVLAAKMGKFKGFRLHGMRPPAVCCTCPSPPLRLSFLCTGNGPCSTQITVPMVPAAPCILLVSAHAIS